MDTGNTIRAFSAIVLLSTVAVGEEVTTSEWLENHAVPKTTETRELNSSREVQSLTVVRERSIQVKEKFVETFKRDKTGFLKVTSRTRQTDTTDAFGGRKTIKEALVGSGGLAIVEETETFKSANATEITTRKLNGSGQLVIAQRVTRTLQEDGTTVTVVEGLGDGGRLVVRKITTQD